MSYFFKTKNGAVVSTQPFLNGNLLETTGYLLWLYDGMAELLIKGIQDLELSWGAFSRQEDKRVNTSQDDHLGVSLYPDFARRWIWRGRLNLGFIDVVHPWPMGGLCAAVYNWFCGDNKTERFTRKPFRQFLFRFQSLWQTAKISARCGVGPLGKYIWARSVMIAGDADPTEQDPWIQTDFMIMVYKNAKALRGFGNKRMDDAVSYWESKKPKPIWEIMADKIGDPNHPLVRARRAYG